MRPHSNPSEYPSKLLVKIPSGQNQAESLSGLAKLFNKGHSRKRQRCCILAIYGPILMNFCMCKSFGSRGKHAKFQQGHKGRKVKGHKAIKARSRNVQKLIFRACKTSVCALKPFLRAEVPIIAEAM